MSPSREARARARLEELAGDCARLDEVRRLQPTADQPAEPTATGD